ncbi:MAG TPA: hypothetical protein PLX97_06115 [Gemmatales bacterium]|nr:hypothetical protein [Gemmatales bacterium]
MLETVALCPVVSRSRNSSVRRPPRHATEHRILLWLLALILAVLFHGCHLGGHEDDLLRHLPPSTLQE